MTKHLFLFGLATIALVYTSSAQSTDSTGSVITTDSVITKVVEIDEVVVKAMLVKHNSHYDEYRMLPKITHGATSVYEVLSRLPGVEYNNFSKILSVRMDPNVLVEVNGTRVSPDYVQALPIDRVSRVQVVYVPSARYTSEGFRYVINIKLKSEYKGHDLYLSNFTMISAGNNNGSDIIANEQPKFQYIYSGENVDVTAGYGFGTINWNYPISYSKSYFKKDNTPIASIKSAEVSAKNPNDLNANLSHYANLGVDWQIAPYQTLSLRGTFFNDGVDHQTIFDVEQDEASTAALENYREISTENSKANDGAGALYYQGMFENGWSIYSALGYEKMRDNVNYLYQYKNNVSSSADSTFMHYRNDKDYFRGELDLNYSFNEVMTLNFGYRGIWNRYMSHDRDGTNDLALSNNDEGRHNGYIFFDWMATESLMLHFGTGVEAIGRTGLEEKRNWFEVLPQLTLVWQPSEKVQVMADYLTKMDYPTLYQVSATPSFVDRWLIRTGNAQLSPSRLHTVSLQGTFFESLVIGAEYIHTHNDITSWYSTRDTLFSETLINARTRQFAAVGAYNWEITKSLSWNNILQWQWQQIEGQGLSNQVQNLVWHSNVEYFIQPIALLAKVEYLREMQKIPLLQGWQHYGQDLWQLSLSKSFFDESLLSL